MLRVKATNTSLVVFGLTRPGPEPKIYRTRGEHANYYATDAVQTFWLIDLWCLMPLSAISWPPVLLVEEAGVPGEKFTKLGTNPCRISDRLVRVVRSSDLTHWATRFSTCVIAIDVVVLWYVGTLLISSFLIMLLNVLQNCIFVLGRVVSLYQHLSQLYVLSFCK